LGYPAGFGVRRPTTSFASLQDLKEAVKTNGKRSPLRQFENPLHNGKRLNAVRK